ncbi:helix-turn-helix transcriptional regulator [Humibacter sp.]|uniref:helix-turn-helix domain-containing protein n=1 Tax=Humibacter sp. TaxID=1940291 RepID=UPI002B79C7BD|nr:helix-turn-helix transcriptional regulator [Humibacter sp.]HVX09198.1 helix-turn-helix transcriptional regulator [Humibacter sp.]
MVAVTARTDRDLLLPDRVRPVGADRFVDVRGGAPAQAGTFAFDRSDSDEIVTGWHHHDMHQVEYALRGTVEVETRTAHYLLPPQQAVWIPAGLEHCTTIRRVSTVSVFFAPELVPDAGDRARVLAAAPVVREMIVHAMRWPVWRTDPDPRADTFFLALAGLVSDWLDHETPLRLPTSSDPLIAAAMAYTREHLDDVTVVDVARAVGVSDRTLRRAFASTTGMSWRRYLLEARLLRAMALLSGVSPSPTVLDVATEVGFESVSAFTRAFRAFVGEPPTAYRRRVTG